MYKLCACDISRTSIKSSIDTEIIRIINIKIGTHCNLICCLSFTSCKSMSICFWNIKLHKGYNQSNLIKPHKSKIFISTVDHTKSFLPLWLHWSPLKTTPSISSSLAFLDFTPPPMASISTTLKFSTFQIPLNRFLFSLNTTKLSFPPSISFPSTSTSLLKTKTITSSLPPSSSPPLSTSPTKSQIPISVAGARVENVRFGQKTKKKRKAEKWAKDKKERDRESINFVTFVKLVNSIELTEFDWV